MSSEIQTLMHDIGAQAKEASSIIAASSTEQRNIVLKNLAVLLRENCHSLIATNQPDVQRAIRNNLETPMVERLYLSTEIIETLAVGCEQLAAMPDPIGQIINVRNQPSGIAVGQMRVPLGVFGMIYESRPNVTIEAASLAIKTGNAAILRGGSEAIGSNQALAELVQQALEKADLPREAIQLVPTTNRDAVGYLLAMSEYVDVLIPRGGRELIERVSAEAKMPIIKHLDGNCHTYVDDPVDIEMALKVVTNAKTQKYSPCNATEGLLIARSIAPEFLPRIAEIFAQKNVEMRVTPEVHRFFLDNPVPGVYMIPVAADEWTREYLAPIIRVKLVKNVQEAIKCINRYSSHHTDAILTSDYNHAQQFMREVDSSSVMVNASTRFADGFEYGLGAEIGISTDKLHARGPVGLEGLTSMKWIVLGHGEIRV